MINNNNLFIYFFLLFKCFPGLQLCYCGPSVKKSLDQKLSLKSAYEKVINTNVG